MKKLITIFAVCLIVLAGCGSNTNLPSANDADGSAKQVPLTSDSGEANDSQAEAVKTPADEIIEIKEKMFVAQTNDIYYNAEDYLGKTIKYEGVFTSYEAPKTGIKYYSVIRYGPGCCGSDGNVGFEVQWNDAYPNQDDWVEAIGVLEEYEENGYVYLRLALSSLNVMSVRGTEYVEQ